MKNINEFEFHMLKGSQLVAEMITNRVRVCLQDTDVDIMELAESVSNSSYHVRYEDFDNMATVYFMNPIDRSRFLDSVNQNI